MTYEREQMLSREEVCTAVATDVFDDLVASLEHPAQPNDELVRAAERARHQVAR